jgi:hypothetical protein
MVYQSIAQQWLRRLAVKRPSTWVITRNFLSGYEDVACERLMTGSCPRAPDWPLLLPPEPVPSKKTLTNLGFDHCGFRSM